MSDKSPDTKETASPNSTPRPTGFSLLLSKAFSYQKRYIKMICAFLIIPIAAQLALNVYMDFVTPEQKDISVAGYAMAVIVGFTLLIWFLDFLAFGATIRYVAQSQRGKMPSFREALEYAFSRVWEAIVLAFRIFIYTYAWLLLLIILLLSGQAILMYVGIGAPNMNIASIPGLNFVLVIAFFIVFIQVIIRSLAITFAYPLLLADEKMTSAEALEKSVSLSRGMKGSIFVNYLLLGILFGLVGAIYGGIMSSVLIQVMGISGNYASESEVMMFSLISGILLIPLLLALRGLMVMFQLTYAESAVEEKQLFGESEK